MQLLKILLALTLFLTNSYGYLKFYNLHVVDKSNSTPQEIQEAKAFLEANVESIKNVADVEKANSADGMENIAQNEKNLDFYKENIHGSEQISINDVVNETIETGLQDLTKKAKTLYEQDTEETYKIVKENIKEYAQNTSYEEMKEDVKQAVENIVTDMQKGAAQLNDTVGLSTNDIAKVYNITQEEAVEVKNAIILIAGASMSGVVKDTFKGGIDLGIKGDKSPYNPNKAREGLEAVHGAENVTSTTNPKNPQQALTIRDNVIVDANGNKAVQFEMPDGTTKNIPYDNRGLPIFDDVSEFTTIIDKSKSPKGQMKQASKDMWEAIKNDPIAQGKFTKIQLNDMRLGKGKIKDFTWHHNAQSSPNNMQLIPEVIHNANLGGVPHTGQVSLNKVGVTK